jgi:hypothetical protein
MSAELRRQVRERAGGRCEYCHLLQEDSILPFHVEHVVPRQHRGKTELSNLALSCPHCNLHKGPNLAGVDPDTGLVSLLFHPRQHLWDEHFVQVGRLIEGRTPIGRTTIWVLAMNTDEQARVRRSLG